jgi:signal transduction histidine kinase
MSDPARAGVDERRPRGWRSFAFDVALAFLATGVELASVLDAGGRASVPAIVMTAVVGGALVLRRSAPLAVLATTLVCGVMVVAFGEEPAGVAGGVALYTTAAMCELRVSLAALVPTAAIAAGGSAATADAEGRTASTSFGATVAVLLFVGIWALGAYVQTRRRYTRALQERAADAEREREQLARIAVHEERASIARELHDIVAHSVSVMLVGVRGARDVLRSSPDVADDTLARVEASGEQSLAELRRILALLREPDRGAESRPQPSLAELDELVAGYRAAGLPVRLEVIGEARPLPGGVELSVYRIVQEALTNVLKHSRATRVTVTLAFRRSRLEIEVVDDGTPEPGAAADRNSYEHAARGSGQGLVGMRERVAVLGGELETGRRVGGGFRVSARLPVGGDA